MIGRLYEFARAEAVEEKQVERRLPVRNKAEYSIDRKILRVKLSECGRYELRLHATKGWRKRRV